MGLSVFSQGVAVGPLHSITQACLPQSSLYRHEELGQLGPMFNLGLIPDELKDIFLFKKCLREGRRERERENPKLALHCQPRALCRAPFHKL